MIHYEQDLYAWATEQAKMLRAGRLSEIDAEHLAEEIEGLSAREKRELRRRLAILIQHLLKWQYQPERQSVSWQLTITNQRDEILEILKDSPSLNEFFAGLLSIAYAQGKKWAELETGLKRLPDECPYTLEQIMQADFLP
jgi:hypothetical protein